MAGLAATVELSWQMGKIALHMWAEQRSPGPALPDEALGLISATIGAAVSIWLAFALAASALAALSAGSRIAGPTTRTAHCIAPALLRNGVAALLGLTLVAVPVSAQAATSPPDTWRPAATSRLMPTEPLELTGATLQTGSATITGDRSSTPTDGPHPSVRETFSQSLSPGWTPQRPKPSGVGSVVRHGRLEVLATGNPTAVRHHTVVHPHDTLWTIAARQLGPGATDAQIAAEWPRWYRANRHLIGADPHLLLPGERLRAPLTINAQVDREDEGR